jgi:uncharacterized protein YggE
MMILSAAPVSIAQTTILTPDTSKTVSVTGHGSVSTVPDTASADVGVSIVDSDARKAKAAVDATVAKILSVAKGLGVAEVDLRTAAVNIEPRYDEKDRTRLRGYEVTQSVTATIHDLSKLDSFLDGAVQAGANRDFNVTLSSSREAALKQQALKLAIDAAKEQADAAARQLNVRLGAVRSINLNTDHDRCERRRRFSHRGPMTPAVIVTVAFSVIGVVGDYFLKLASARDQPLRTGWFYVGFVLYASTAFGWVFVMKYLKLATISVLYSVSMVLLLTTVGVVVFRESLNYSELAGIGLALASLVLLMRFA